MRYRELPYLAGAYFHQDYDLDADTPPGVVRYFKESETVEVRDALIREVQDLMAEGLDDDNMYRRWVHEWGSCFYPGNLDISWENWFQDVLEILNSP
ncbi:contact-dependent growth inhibition system immunity protein [Actinomadura adrarensis]|uniref:Contact-dependent growth inhibition system immunity protein n=1 Tax=Actinomadura adrarensis TaxID=1819600 RepID=A0ABW3CP46_9ACTN